MLQSLIALSSYFLIDRFFSRDASTIPDEVYFEGIFPSGE